MKSIKKALTLILPTIVYVYFIGWVFAIPYYNYQYANNNGFMKWVFFGEVVATYESMGWPYDAYQHNFGKRTKALSTEAEKELTFFNLSIESISKANNITNNGKAWEVIPDEDIEKIKFHLQEALSASEFVSSKSLKKLHKKLPIMYETKFRRGLKLMIEGFNKNGENATADFISAQKMLNDFGDWYVENLRK